jgi:3-dehydroquinate dehydratase-1
MTKPIICVPVIERQGVKLLEKMEVLINHQVPMIEWRMDYFEEVESFQSVRAMLKEMEAFSEKTQLLCTYRSNNQGGVGTISPDRYLTLLRIVAESKAAELVDLEFFQVEEPFPEVAHLKSYGKKVIASHHDFHKTPSLAIMKRQLLYMQKSGADYIKMAVMPQSKIDVVRLMETVMLVKEEVPDSKIIAMSMGQEGAITRVAGEWFGSEITFAAFGTTSAPGQIFFEDEQELLDSIHEILK